MNSRLSRYIMGGMLLIVACSNTTSLCRHSAWPANFFYNKRVAGNTGAVAQQNTVLPDVPGAERVSWQLLKDVTYRKKWNKEFQLDFMYPVFGGKVKKLNGKPLTISGYMVPLNIKEGLYAVSQTTYASCYFCGQSGPESVVSLKFANKPHRYKIDQYVTVSGVMSLNDTDVNDFIYIFRQAKEVADRE